MLVAVIKVPPSALMTTARARKQPRRSVLRAVVSLAFGMGAGFLCPAGNRAPSQALCLGRLRVRRCAGLLWCLPWLWPGISPHLPQGSSIWWNFCPQFLFMVAAVRRWVAFDLRCCYMLCFLIAELTAIGAITSMLSGCERANLVNRRCCA